MKDLVCLVADKSMEAAVRALLSRSKALAIRALDYDTFVHPRRDPGCFGEGHEFLLPLRADYTHGLVVFDRAWEGAPSRNAGSLEEAVRGRLAGAGLAEWGDVVVIEPELEAWVWSDSPHVDQALGWKGRNPGLRDWLTQQALWPAQLPKPADPKRAVERALEVARRPRSASIYGQLARNCSLDRCSDPAFGRFRRRLHTWFGDGPD